MASNERTTVTLPVELHEAVFGDAGIKPYSSMSNAEFIEEMAETYRRVKAL